MSIKHGGPRRRLPAHTGEVDKASPKASPKIKNRSRMQTIAARSKFAKAGEIGQVFNEIHKGEGPGIIRVASEKAHDYGRVSTGILSLDIALAGGLLQSRGSMLYGERSAGKSTLALIVIKRILDKFPDKVAVWMDVEGTFDRIWAKKLGVDLERLLITEPESGESAIDIADGVLRANEVSMVVTDSIAMLIPMKEIEGSAEDNFPGIHARLVGNYIRRMNNGILKERHRRHVPIVLHLNQFRMRFVQWGDPRTLPGGKALEFSTSQQVLLTNKEIKGKDDQGNNVVTHNEHGFQITKDKTGGRIKEGKFKLIRDPSTGFPEGYVDQTKTVLTFAAHAGLFQGRGTRQEIKDVGVFRSHAEIGEYFLNNPEALEVLNSKIIGYYRDKWGLNDE